MPSEIKKFLKHSEKTISLRAENSYFDLMDFRDVYTVSELWKNNQIFKTFRKNYDNLKTYGKKTIFSRHHR